VLELTSEPLGFRARQVVRVVPSMVTTIPVELPRVPVSINALPWADVWIDGMRAGQTPLGNVLEPIGTHEIEFRHPQFGTKRMTYTVSLSSPARVAVDMRIP
jgi:hypothetical protein